MAANRNRRDSNEENIPPTPNLSIIENIENIPPSPNLPIIERVRNRRDSNEENIPPDPNIPVIEKVLHYLEVNGNLAIAGINDATNNIRGNPVTSDEVGPPMNGHMTTDDEDTDQDRNSRATSASVDFNAVIDIDRANVRRRNVNNAGQANGMHLMETAEMIALIAQIHGPGCTCNICMEVANANQTDDTSDDGSTTPRTNVHRRNITNAAPAPAPPRNNPARDNDPPAPAPVPAARAQAREPSLEQIVIVCLLLMILLLAYSTFSLMRELRELGQLAYEDWRRDRNWRHDFDEWRPPRPRRGPWRPPPPRRFPENWLG